MRLLPALLLLVAAHASARADSRLRVDDLLPAIRPEIIAYNRFWYILYFIGFAWQIAAYVLLIRFRFGPRLRTALERRFARPWLRQALFYMALMLVLMVWNLPIGWAGYLHERAYGFSTESPWLWLADHGRGYLFGLITVPILWFGYWLVRKSPRRWWLWLWAASVPWQALMVVVSPLVIAPAYNDFKPLKDDALTQRLLNLADRAGVHGARVFEVDISKRTTKLNAYVTGIGPSKRIVIWDTTLKALTPDEVVAIMAHELGHYVLGHIWWRLAAGIAGAFVLLWLLAKLYPWAVARWGARYGVEGVQDLGGLPIFLLVLHLLVFLQMPVESAFTRAQEHAADRYALELNGDGVSLAKAFALFVEHDYSDPDPPAFFQIWFGSHPTLRERIAFALANSRAGG